MNLRQVFKAIDGFFNFKYDMEGVYREARVKANMLFILLESKYKDIKEFLNHLNYNSKHYNHTKIAPTPKSITNTVEDAFKPFLMIMETPIYQKWILETKEIAAKNYEMFYIFQNLFCDKYIYLNLNPIMEKIIGKNQINFKKKISIFLSLFENKRSTDDVLKSINWISEDIGFFKSISPNTRLDELFKNYYLNYMKVLNADKNDFGRYLYDWTLQTSNLIESEIKKIFQLLILLFLGNQEIIPINEVLELSLGDIIILSGGKDRFKNINRLKIYRNANHHSNFEIKYNNVDIRNSELTFKDFQEVITITLAEFEIDFLKILKFGNTFIYIISILEFKLENNGKDPFIVQFEKDKKEFYSKYPYFV